MAALLWILAILLVIIGLVGIVVPALPGPVLVYAGLFLAAWIDGFEKVGWLALAVLGGLALRYVSFPKMQEEELERSLKFEAQKHIPFSLNEVNFDSHILNDSMPDSKMLVLLAAVKKEFLNNRLSLIDSTPLRIRLLDVDSLALINAFNFNYAEDESVVNKTV